MQNLKGTGSVLVNDGFQSAMNQFRAEAETLFSQGTLFEQLMKRCILADPLYADRFSDAWLCGEWVQQQEGIDEKDTGIDLVAGERNGGYCAIQCKSYARHLAVAPSRWSS